MSCTTCRSGSRRHKGKTPGQQTASALRHLQGGASAPRCRYNAGLSDIQAPHIMEAERLNAIANHLTDLQSRAGELRRYL
jgi:hypothetical protein